MAQQRGEPVPVESLRHCPACGLDRDASDFSAAPSGAGAALVESCACGYIYGPAEDPLADVDQAADALAPSSTRPGGGL